MAEKKINSKKVNTTSQEYENYSRNGGDENETIDINDISISDSGQIINNDQDSTNDE
jgi:hypothetical protein